MAAHPRRGPIKKNGFKAGPLSARKVAPPGGAPAKPRSGKPGFKEKRRPRQGPRPGPHHGGRAGPRFGAEGLPASVRILHEDGDLIVVDKPPGLLTANIPGEFRPALFDMLKRHVRSRGPRRGPKRPRRDENAEDGAVRPRWAGQGVYVIHRLDKEASGLLVFAKSEKAFGWLKDDFKTKRAHRLYTALVEGEMGAAGTSGTIQSFLREGPTGKVESIATDAYRGPARATEREGFDPGAARLAVTHYRVIGSGNGRTLVQLRIDTGRKHQIRVHLADRGHPVVGDRRYGRRPGAADDAGFERLHLHASELGFGHPGTGQTVRFSSPPPPQFYRAVGMEPPARPAGAERTEVRAPAAPPSHAEIRSGPAADTSWEGVAGWYDAMQGGAAQEASDHYRDVIIPGTLRLVQPRPGERILEVACGQGVISRALAGQGASVVGVDASPSLIEAARARGGGAIDYRAGDARELEKLGLDASGSRPFDGAACVMALGNIEPLEPVLRGIAALLRPGARFIGVISHPAFRAPGQTSWAFDEAAGKQHRRIEGYLSTGAHPIQMHPGKAAAGAPGGEAVTWTFHRPLQHYARLLGEAGLLIETIEEWPSMRVSEPGPRASEENRARREIPLFLAWRAVKRA